MKKVNYKKASTYYLVANLFNKGMSFLTVPIFTRILSTTDYGIVTTYNSWVAILAMVIGFALHMAIRAAFIDYKEKIDDFLSVTITFTVLSGILISTFVLLGCWLLKIDIGITLIVLCLLHSLSSALTTQYTHYLMMQYRYKFKTALMVLPNLISVLLSIAAIMLVVKSDLYMGRIVPTAIVHIVFGILVLMLVYRKSHVLFDKEYISFGLKVSAPLVLHGIALNILSQSDRTMITALADASQTGIYSLVYNFSMLATVITSALEGVWIPWFTNKLKERNIKEINVLVKDYVNFITYAMIGLILIGPEVIKLMAAEKYWEGIIIVPPVVLANYFIFMYTLYVNIEHFHKKTPYITLNTIIAALVNIGLNFVFIPKYGYIAAAYTTLVSYVLAFVLHARYAKKLEKELYPIRFFIVPLVHILVAVIVFYVLVDMPVLRWVVVWVYIAAMFVKERYRIGALLPFIADKFKFFKQKN